MLYENSLLLNKHYFLATQPFLEYGVKTVVGCLYTKLLGRLLGRKTNVKKKSVLGRTLTIMTPPHLPMIHQCFVVR